MCFLGHLPVPRESVTHRALFRRRWRAKPPPYPEMTTNAKWVHGHWTIQVDFHRSMASFLMACKTTADTPINVNPVNVGTKQDNNVRPTGNQHTTNRAMAGVKAHTLVGPSAIMLDPCIWLCMPLLTTGVNSQIGNGNTM